MATPSKSKQITYKDRVIMEHMIQDGCKSEGIACILNRHKNTIAIEFSRSGMSREEYKAIKAQLLV